VSILIREQLPGGTGTTTLDRELDSRKLTFGSAPDCSVQILGRGVARQHGTLQPEGGGLALSCGRGLSVQVNGERSARMALKPGDVLELAGSRIRVLDAPAGFDAAIAVEPTREVQPADFESAYVTSLDQTWLSRRKPAWILALIILLGGLAVPFLAPRDAVPEWTSDAVWSSGPLHPAHAVAVGDDCGACHSKPFQRVQDEACTTCHQRVTDHAAAALAGHVGLDERRCASCHREHNEPVHITISADALCTDCHAEPDWPDNRLAAVAGFSPARHPAFTADLLVSTAESAGTGLGYRWQRQAMPLPEAVDASNLKFPHDVHLDAAQVTDPNSGAALACGDCHTLQADDEHFAPVRMEQHCRDCHDLKFDRRAPERELPHADPAEALLTMEGHYMRMFADPEAGEPARTRRRLPDRGSAEERCDEPAYVCARRRTAQEAETQFTRRGCVTCHEVVVHDTADLLGRYQVVPVRLTDDFFVAARFDHRAHLTQKDRSDDTVCLDCHDARASNTSRDVLIPDVDNCLACHSDHRSRQLVPLHCIDCHEFHPRGSGEGAE
jgi:hypothetical protein